MAKRITKNDISGPTPLQTTNQYLKQSFDSGIDVRSENQRKQVQQNNFTGAIPFAVGRHDVSVSVAGGPYDPRNNESKEPKTMTYMQYQTFVHAIGAYKRQIQAMAAATETFVRALQEVADCVPAAQVNDVNVVSDLDFLIDSSQLIVNAHQTWANNIEKEVEEPLTACLNEIPQLAKTKQEANKQQIQKLIQQLHSEEDSSYKMKKKKTRDLAELQKSLNLRMALADEIKRLSLYNECIPDKLSQENVPFILQLLTKTVEAELETYETISEGFHKIGSVMDSRSPDGFRNRNSFFSNGSIHNLKIPTEPNTEILPTSPDKELNMEFIRAAMANFL
ncbi:hypothetical protein HDV06_004607 [Boothiomyces sp. JEL0866]|nr:hypothetical protein HDV06_004607 [Boothiomyces sp. JEL0866]